MKESQSKKKTSRLTKVIISLGVVLATTFFTFFLIG
ncbi:TPA: polysaccharide deacetylase, partial [Bacillus thuringiensis]|nr:polysaccharide deacetylase [Bacillus thuringiensis]